MLLLQPEHPPCAVSTQTGDQVPEMLSILLKVNFEGWLCKGALLQRHLLQSHLMRVIE